MFPLSGTLFSLDGYRLDSSSGENASAELAPGQPPNKSAINIYDTVLPDTLTRFYSARTSEQYDSLSAEEGGPSQTTRARRIEVVEGW